MPWRKVIRRSLKLFDKIMKVMERAVEGLIKERVSTGVMQFDIRPGRGSTDTVAG